MDAVRRNSPHNQEEQETSANNITWLLVRNGYRSGSSSWYESCCLRSPAVYILLCVGHRPAFCGQRSRTPQVFPSQRVLGHPSRHCSSNTAPLYRSLHCSYHVEESQTKESGLTSGCDRDYCGFRPSYNQNHDSFSSK